MERDDIIEYSLHAHHSEEKGKQIRKTIWKVTALLTIITIVEVALGAYIKQGSGAWPFVKWSFIIIAFLLLSWGDIIFGLIVGGIIFYAVIRFIINDSERKYG